MRKFLLLCLTIMHCGGEDIYYNKNVTGDYDVVMERIFQTPALCTNEKLVIHDLLYVMKENDVNNQYSIRLNNYVFEHCRFDEQKKSVMVIESGIDSRFSYTLFGTIGYDGKVEMIMTFGFLPNPDGSVKCFDDFKISGNRRKI